MEINPLQRPISAKDIAPEQLAGNTALTEKQKIGEASRQFEAVLLRQILTDAQKTVIQSKFSDNSTASGIYKDLITSTLADSISKSGAFGIAQTFDRQLTPTVRATVKPGADDAASDPPQTQTKLPGKESSATAGTVSATHLPRAITLSAKLP